MGRWAGGPIGWCAGWPVASKNIMIYYFCWPLMLSIIIIGLHDCLSKVVMAKRHRRKTVKIKLHVMFHFNSYVTFGHYNS